MQILPPSPRAVLCDMDGTLLDTEKLWDTALTTWATAHRLRLTAEHRLFLRGNTVAAGSSLLAELAGSAAVAEQIGAEIEAWVIREISRGVRFLPGAEELLDDIAESGIPLALVTASPMSWVERCAPRLDLDRFHAVVSADDVTRTKPDPEPYQLAARLLGFSPEECIALEDSAIGTRSALAAGCQVLVIGGDPHEFAHPEFSAAFHLESLRNLDWNGLLLRTEPRVRPSLHLSV